MRRRAVVVLVVFVVGLLAVSSSSLVAETALVRFVGEPKFSDGRALGYFVWNDGDTWKLRWTTFGAEHRFSGRIVLEGGQIKDMKRIDVDTERKIIAPGRPARVVRGPRGRVRTVTPGRGAVVAERQEDTIEQETERVIRFNTVTDDDIDGVNFSLSGPVQLIRFVLEIDGKPQPAEVEVGRNNFKPNENPIVVRF